MEVDFFADTILSNWVFVYFVVWFLGYASPNPLYLFYFIIVAYYSVLIYIAVIDPKNAPYSAIAMICGVFGKLVPTWLILHSQEKKRRASSRDAFFAAGFLAAYFAWISVARHTDIFAVYRKMFREETKIPFTVENIPRMLLVLLGVLWR